MKKYAVVVVGYNRSKSIARLLSSLLKAEYPKNVDLIISIDFGDNEEVIRIANEFKWEYGEKKIFVAEEKLGLRKHILKCGGFLEYYDAIAMLEDDLIVSPAYFVYMIQAVERYGDDDKIAGISLYSFKWSESHNRQFQPEITKYDTFYLQYAQSWGQIWLKNQWFEFLEWYKNGEIDFNDGLIPKNISNWPETSWLKYHIKYCVEKDKYFVYPYISLSTNFTEVGEHNKLKNSLYQVPLLYDTSKTYSFPKLDGPNPVIYDVFFERKEFASKLNLKSEELCVDIYGGKEKVLYKKFLLTMENHDFEIVNSYGIELRPHEMNVAMGISGNDIFLYDTEKTKKQKIEDVEIKKWNYDLNSRGIKLLGKVVFNLLKSNFKR